MGDSTVAIHWDYAREVLQKADGVLATVGLEADLALPSAAASDAAPAAAPAAAAPAATTADRAPAPEAAPTSARVAGSDAGTAR